MPASVQSPILSVAVLACGVLAWGLLLMALLAGAAAACPAGCQCTESGMVQCTSRDLKKVPSDLPRDTSILLLASNRITHVADRTFAELHSLTELNLSHNAIEQVDAEAFQGVADSLRCLDLSHNNLRGVPTKAFARLRAKISLAHNPWHCQCSLQEVLRELQLEPETVNEVRCHTAVLDEYAGEPLIQVLDSGIDFCNYHHKTTDVAMLVTMLGWLAMVVTYIMYYVRHNQEDARRHLDYLKSLPSSSQVSISRDLDSVSTIL